MAMASMIAYDVYDVVLGSRVLGGTALTGGMPYYKYVANCLLTAFQNFFLGAILSEYHPGFRAFSRNVLLELPLLENSDDFVFDNEMLTQCIYAGFRIGEVSCPTKYFPEASSINFRRSLTYGMGVVVPPRRSGRWDYNENHPHRALVQRVMATTAKSFEGEKAHPKSSHAGFVGDWTSCLVVVLLAMLAVAGCRRSTDEAMQLGGQGADGPLVFSTFLGPAGARDVAVDRQGFVYVTGGTESSNFPVTPGAYQTKFNPGVRESFRVRPSDVFVTKLSPSGAIVWSTLIGGPNHDRAYAIALDADEYVYVAGRAGRGFPVTPGALQPNFMGGQEADFYGGQDGFVCKLKPDGTALVFCSYFGTSDFSIIRDLAVDRHGDIYIASAYSSGEFSASIARAFNNRPHGGRDVVVAKLKGDGSRVLWATYLGGSGDEDNTNSIRLDAAGNPYALMTTTSADAETTPGAYQRTYGGGGDLYVARLTPDTGALVWATYLGGPQNESTETHELAVDAQGNVYIAAPTKSPSFPTTPGAFQRQFGGVHDIFVAKLSPDGSRLLASTFIGGDGPDRPEGVAVDALGNVYFTGVTASTNFPLTPDAVQSRRKGSRDAVAVVLAADFSRLLFSTLMGGNGDQSGRGATVDARENFYIVGETSARDWPLKNAARAHGSGADAFVIKITLPEDKSRHGR